MLVSSIFVVQSLRFANVVVDLKSQSTAFYFDTICLRTISTISHDDSHLMSTQCGNIGVWGDESCVGAAAGTLSFMVGGTKEDFAEAEPLLRLMGTNVFYCGPVGSGEVVKLCNNLMLGISMLGKVNALYAFSCRYVH